MEPAILPLVHEQLSGRTRDTCIFCTVDLTPCELCVPTVRVPICSLTLQVCVNVMHGHVKDGYDAAAQPPSRYDPVHEGGTVFRTTQQVTECLGQRTGALGRLGL